MNEFASQFDRRTFIASAGATALVLALPNLTAETSSTRDSIIVSPNGADDAPGSLAHPVRSLDRALALSGSRERSTILLRAGTYELTQPLHITAANAPFRIANYAHEDVILSGGTRLQLAWRPYRDGIFQATVPSGTATDQLFINNRRQILARYPNFDANARYLNGFAADAISPERVARWKNPAGGYIHALQRSLWGSLHYRITGKDADNTLHYEGGWQINSGNQPMHKEYVFVENIFEELDAPGEWFLDEHSSTLYFYPPAGLDLDRAAVDVVRLTNLITIGDASSPHLRNLTLAGLTFRHTLRTFMETREPLLRSDWRIYRGGALYVEGVEDLTIEDCFFDQLGGNAIFMSGYNRRVHVRGCRIEEAGASGVCFVGRPEAVRNAVTWPQKLSFDTIDLTQGPCSEAYAKVCSVEDTLVVATGRVEKQSAPVEISMSQSITVSHCSLYGVPRAGINIGDGTWGGHIIEYCDVFDTVLETADHGAFNSWGRDRWWHLQDADPDKLLLDPKFSALPTLDAMLPNTLIRNRWACEHGWDIDLDDGSTNFHIAENLCLCGGIKLREGFLRVVENNIMVHNTLHPHVWPKDSQDVVRRNIFFLPYRPIRPEAWGKEIDFNLLHHPGMLKPQPAVSLQRLSGQDAHSLEADARFLDSAHGHFSVGTESPAIELGFRNFPMHEYGVRSPRLRALARTPDIPRLLRVQPVSMENVVPM
ncbi:MAG: right-handed parallel beta-helix repeat-containing protein [Terracidiphilus sp.]